MSTQILMLNGRDTVFLAQAGNKRGGKIIVTHTVTDKDKQKAFRESQKGKDHRGKAKADGGEELEQ